jgi:hemerythrin-like domain-containing protein
MTKSEVGNANSSFGLRDSFVIRHSCFVISLNRRTIMKSRRQILVAGAVLGVSGVAAVAEQPPADEEVSAVEDLMREHGVLRRILLIYEECVRRLRSKKELPPGALVLSATVVRKFVEDYHEKLEEDFLFPEFEKRGQLAPLVKVLREQHAAGRTLTDVVFRHTAARQAAGESSPEVITACEPFIRMYGPHAAREDTVLFPALRKILSAKQLDELGDKFEAEEDRRFGREGFEKTVEQVATIEKTLGIYDLAQFTPKVK